LNRGDIVQLSVEECLRITNLMPGELDVLDGSLPCQGFSTAGKRKMDDGRNQLSREYVRLLRGLKPKVFVMENVSAMVKGKMKLIFAGKFEEGIKQIGNCVPPLFMRAIAYHIKEKILAGAAT
jgi:DNA (cytosine-5)-methyltransferase 1